ncbi:MAG: hypothetical protein H0W69_10450, partial [Gemmatimonadaceae bacterium]|nr:hypothetical protein [Gemmatimonadaceae bacterium]
MGFVVGAATAAVMYFTPRKYIASTTLSTIAAPPKSISMSGGLGSLLSGATMGGGSANPALIVRIAGEYGVLLRVANSPVREGSKERIIDRMRSISRGKIPDNQVVRTMRKIARASYDKGSGVIVVAAE